MKNRTMKKPRELGLFLFNFLVQVQIHNSSLKDFDQQLFFPLSGSLLSVIIGKQSFLNLEENSGEN